MSSQENVPDTKWRSQAGYVWSLIGSAVGFANILSFSAHVYKNGGGAFLIPYSLALIFMGIPLLILEGIVGSNFKLPLVSAFGRVWGRVGKVFGWLAVIACLTIGSFYIVLTGYSVAYTYFSAMDIIPSDTEEFFLKTFLGVTSDIADFGNLSLPIFMSTIGVALLTWCVLSRSIREGVESVCSIFMPMLVIIMTTFAVVVAFLPGGLNGWSYYLKPDFIKLGEPSLWRDIFGQLFFSLSLGLGIVVGYSRHSGKDIDIPKAMISVALGDFFVSFISGAAIFGCLAHVSYVEGIPFEKMLNTDSTFEIGFVVFPRIFKFFGSNIGPVIGVIFFFCIFIAGITGVFSIVESISGNIEVEFGMKRKKAVTATLIVIVSFAMMFCMGNASHIIDALVPMVMGTNMLIGGMVLILAFYMSSKDIRSDISWGRHNGLGFYSLCLKGIAPGILSLILMSNLYEEFLSFDTARSVRWTWFSIALVLASLLALSVRKNINV